MIQSQDTLSDPAEYSGVNTPLPALLSLQVWPPWERRMTSSRGPEGAGSWSLSANLTTHQAASPPLTGIQVVMAP